MLRLVEGDLLFANVEALVNPVNCVGVRGSGLAQQFKQKFPANFLAYQKACRAHEVQPGKTLVFQTNSPNNPRFIINFPTKRHWREGSRLEDIEAGLATLVNEVKAREIKSIAIPALGCGLGGLKWEEVRPMIENAFRELPEVFMLLFQPLRQKESRSCPE